MGCCYSMRPWLKTGETELFCLKGDGLKGILRFQLILNLYFVNGF